MKIPNYLMTSLAFVGAVSLIIMACSTDNATNSTTGTTSLTGKYQTTSGTYNVGSDYEYFHVINTETGVVKSYYSKPGNPYDSYDLYNTTVTQSPDNSTPTRGRYQITSTARKNGNFLSLFFYVTDTETGVVKTFSKLNAGLETPFELINTTNTQLP